MRLCPQVGVREVGRRGGEKAEAPWMSAQREVREKRREKKQLTTGVTNTSIIAPPLPPRLPWTSGLGEEVMTLCPDTAKSHNGILPASAYTSLIGMMIMMMTSAVIQFLCEQTWTIIHSSSFSQCFFNTLLLLGHNFAFPDETVSKVHYLMSKMHNHQA